MVKVVLYEPQIPQNTGNIVRTCAVAGAELLLINPGFGTSDRHLKRAGLDYWEGVRVDLLDDLEGLFESQTAPFTFLSSRGSRRYDTINYGPDHLLIFGSEDRGLPGHFHSRWANHFATIPMLPGSRCLNLATAVGIVLYEALRQHGFTLGSEISF